MQKLESREAFVTEYQISTLPKYDAKDLLNQVKNEVQTEGEINSLLGMYLMAGAKLGGQMAYDSEMDCLDLFTVVDFQVMPLAFRRRFA